MNNRRHPRRSRLASVPTRALLNELHNRKRVANSRRRQASNRFNFDIDLPYLEPSGYDDFTRGMQDIAAPYGVGVENTKYAPSEMMPFKFKVNADYIGDREDIARYLLEEGVVDEDDPEISVYDVIDGLYPY